MAVIRNILLTIYIHLIFIYSVGCRKEDDLLPIILVPGVGGSRLEAQLSKPTVVHSYCTQSTFKFYTLWLDVSELLPFAIDCWVDNIRLNYDSATNKTFNQPGVETRVAGFGNPEVVEYLDPKAKPFIGGYMNSLVSVLLKQGYVRQKNLYAAPYDFRKGPSELEDFFIDLEKLVETAYDYNNAQVILIGHSMGGQLTLTFLQNKSQEWKDKYVRAFISLSSPFGGTMKAIKTFAIGDDLGGAFLPSEVLKDVLSSMSSMAYLLPVKKLWGNEVLVSTVTKNYTVDNLEEFFCDIGNPTGWKMYLNQKNFTEELSPPNVETHCFYGEGIGTLKRMIYGSNDFPKSPMMEYENGDRTANLRSLQYCKTWITQQKERVATKSFAGMDHMGIVEDKLVLDHIIRTVKELSSF